MRSLTILIFLFFVSFSTSAELLVTAPTQVCRFLDDAGLSTRGWTNLYDQEFACSSPYKEIDSGFPLANNVAFYVTGDSTSATQVQLTLNINNRAQASSAHKELLKAAAALSIKTTGKQLPQTLKNAITQGSDASQKVGSATVEVARKEWPTGKGYEVSVTIK